MSELALAPVIAAGGGWFDFLHTIKGPEFLGLYFGWFIVTFATVLVLRQQGHDTPQVSRYGFFAFEALGLARIYVGSNHGMHNWGFLIVMMIGGGLFFILRAHHFEGGGSDTGTDSGGTWWSSDSGSSGGSSGGCGGGGGCGGCGGGGD